MTWCRGRAQNPRRPIFDLGYDRVPVSVPSLLSQSLCIFPSRVERRKPAESVAPKVNGQSLGFVQ